MVFDCQFSITAPVLCVTSILETSHFSSIDVFSASFLSIHDSALAARYFNSVLRMASNSLSSKRRRHQSNFKFTLDNMYIFLRQSSSAQIENRFLRSMFILSIRLALVASKLKWNVLYACSSLVTDRDQCPVNLGGWSSFSWCRTHPT